MKNILAILLLICGSLESECSRFTNIECEALDASYVQFKICNLKVLGRGIVGLNVHAVLLKAPLKAGKVNLSLWRKFNGYRPFMFNTTFDFCRLMANMNKKLSFERIFFDALSMQSNINHSCPFENFLVRNLVYQKEFERFLPLPTGDYKIRLMANANNDWKAIVQVYMAIKEDV